MENVSEHFAKYLGCEIWNTVSESIVILKGLREYTILYLNGEPEEKEDVYSNFKLIVSDEMELVLREIPTEIAVVKVMETIVIKPMKITPKVFLEMIKKILYTPLGIDHDEMLKVKKNRKREYVIVRQIVMASYFCTYEHSHDYKVSLASAGAIYYKDHATVLHAIKNVNNLLDTDKYFNETYSEVWKLCKKVNPKSKLHI